MKTLAAKADFAPFSPQYSTTSRTTAYGIHMDLNSRRMHSAIYFLIAIALIIATTARSFGYTMDDALITLRYSINMADHGLPIWNPLDAQDPSMGFTSSLWMLINSLTGLISADKNSYILASKLISLFAMAAFAYLFVSLIKRQEINTYDGLAIIVLFFSNPIFGFHIASGMETILFSVGLSIFLYLVIENKSYSLIVFSGFVLYLLRPEAGLVVFSYWLYDFIVHKDFKKSAITCVILILLLLIYHGALYEFFGDPLPTPFYIKSASGHLIKSAAVLYTGMFLLLSAAPFILMVIPNLKLAKYRFAFIIVGLLLLFFMTVQPMMNVLYRYQFPILLSLILLSGYALREFYSKTKLWRWAVFTLIVLTHVINYGISDMYVKKVGVQMGNNLKEIGVFLGNHNDGKTWMAWGDVGFIPFYSDYNTVDIWGLNNKKIAKNNLSIEDYLRRDNVGLALRYRSSSPRSDQYEKIDLQSFGFKLLGTALVVKDENSELWIDFFGKQIFFDQNEIDKIPLIRNSEKSVFSDIFYNGKKMVESLAAR